MKPVRLRPLANADIDAGCDWLVREAGAAVASKLLDTLEKCFDEIARQPGSGLPRWSHVLPVRGLRTWVVGGFQYLIFYLDKTDEVDVLRVLHSARDIPPLLGHDGDVSGVDEEAK